MFVLGMICGSIGTIILLFTICSFISNDYILELEEKLYKKVLEISSFEYEVILQKDDKVYVNLESIYGMLEDLVDEYENKEEEYNDLKEDVENHYELKREDVYDEYGVSRNDF